ncbi:MULTISPECIES: S1 RNA-binding domain-containing protein [Caproicibacterium]|jgi:S1 RNA binding domain protein|uniref:S1 RNA-binding domain-containing protein n=1 Tax=Caproicibacterium lactatifermentans TaxID=2666138 RepID=A0A859DU67_9FIRM|nr:S1 RNA-binding domain-containing protein [Caproicibacterium lactatifermentans]ARP50709.1 RNA-binding protein S1 [Ruminococcaceae bacterium CPB6]MDD4807442.1 S1 RNA-binding domain-containing protein [Oscillospiraceae bacterium]QKN23561.1 S1 RNA-binding domain-containing protein [Caproicibacterium lactatifermentans]QKO29763.1 S1 RNA-binding domain-containing protein [Caproicibacterium lactatifermentans]
MQLEVGTVVEGKVTGITSFGAFVELPTGQTGMVHISEIAPTFVREIRDFVSVGQTVKVKILNIGENNKISLSMKQVEGQNLGGNNHRPPQQQQGGRPRQQHHRKPEPQQHRPGNFEWQPRRNEPADFEDMMTHFKQTSDEKISDLKKTLEGKHGGYSRRGNGFH